MSRSRVGLRIALAVAVCLAAAPNVSGANEGAIQGTVRISPIGVSLDVSSTRLPTGQTFRASATVRNLGAAVVGHIVVRLRLDPAGLGISRPGDRLITQLKPGRSSSVSWKVCAGSPGTYILLAQATVGDATVESSATVVTVTAGRRSC